MFNENQAEFFWIKLEQDFEDLRQRLHDQIDESVAQDLLGIRLWASAERERVDKQFRAALSPWARLVWDMEQAGQAFREATNATAGLAEAFRQLGLDMPREANIPPEFRALFWVPLPNETDPA